MSSNDRPEHSTGTFSNEAHLPRVPLPSLQDSCARFLEWCSPLLTADELKATQSAVDAFLQPESAAHALQRALSAYDAQPGVSSWLDTFWPSRYLGRRDRIALNANFFFVFQPSSDSQVARAAGLIAGALHYKLLLDEERLPPAAQRGQPLSMEQNKSLFSETRIPGALQDSVRMPYTDAWPGPSREKHIVVFYRGHAYRLDVYGSAGKPHTLDELQAALSDLIARTDKPQPDDEAIGHLTTKARADWAASRQTLLALSPRNVTSLDTIETALFCVCLEDFAPKSILEASDHLLHGNSANRFFDKSISFIVFQDGVAGINVEHCGLDGTTILSFVDAVLASSPEQHAAAARAQVQGAAKSEELVFELNDALKQDIREAGAAFAAYAAATATSNLSFSNFGSTRAKELRTSPDAFVQMAYQLAHKRSKGFIGATYESIATRQYNHGRTEAMRVVTPEVHAFVAALEDPTADKARKLAAFRAATDAHVARAKQCQSGQAPEQHLWELQLLQKRRGQELGATTPLALYASPGWSKLRDDYLSTSSAPSQNVQVFGFGSTSPQCIGVAYVLLPERLNVYLSTPRIVSAQMTAFAEKLTEAIQELEALLS